MHKELKARAVRFQETDLEILNTFIVLAIAVAKLATVATVTVAVVVPGFTVVIWTQFSLGTPCA